MIETLRNTEIKTRPVFNPIVRTSMIYLCLVAGFVAWLISGAAIAQTDSSILKYKWEPGQQYRYQFEVKYKVDQEEVKLTGEAAYELHKKNIPNDLSGEAFEVVEEDEASCTAFAVTSDGYLLTCAHCVRGAKTINVTVGEKKKLAKVIDIDVRQDLALIKIDATDLSAVTLGKTKTVELAQDVRAVGYPLSDVLGSSVKVTRGSVAGFIDEGNQVPSLQIDAAINHGNSGGPLVDETGSVVGVVNAKLSGAAIAKVGFAIPIKLACQMLDRNKIKYDSRELAQQLPGPELAKKLVPSVLFVETKFGPGGVHGLLNYRYSTMGSMSRSPRGGVRKQTIQSDAIISDDGALLDFNNQTRLPLLLGTVCEMPFESLPHDAGKNWVETNVFALSLPKSSTASQRSHDGFGGMPHFRSGFHRFGHPLGSRFGAPEKKPETQMVLAKSTSAYKIVKQVGNLSTISKTFSLGTIGEESATSGLKMNYKSELVFDSDAGMFVSQKLNGKVRIKVEDKVLNFPIDMTYRKVGYKFFALRGKDQPQPKGAADGVAKGSAEPAMPEVGLTGQQIDRLIQYETKKLPTSELLVYLNRLSSWNEAEDRKPEIVKALSQLASSKDSDVNKSAIDALLNWDQNSATSFLIAGLESASPFSKRTWIVKLGRAGSADAAVVLCQQLENSRLVRHVEAALIVLGPNGEPAVGDALKQHVDNAQIADACLKVLGKVGSQNSTKLIKELLSKQADWKSKSNAESALKQINSRN